MSNENDIKLVDLWIGKQCVDECSFAHEAFNRILKRLKDAEDRCLPLDQIPAGYEFTSLIYESTDFPLVYFAEIRCSHDFSICHEADGKTPREAVLNAIKQIGGE